ncbi:MAG: helix-turn-helix domain-containing protein [Bacteroidota bacterium]|jgi:transcriptional regulator with XRE-family HTH domain
MNNLACRIQIMRKEAGLTQVELAKKIKISPTQFTRYEIRGEQPPVDVLKSLTNALNTSVDFLIHGNKIQKVKDILKDIEQLMQFKKIEQLANDKQKLVKEILDLFIFKTNVQQLSHS